MKYGFCRTLAVKLGPFMSKEVATAAGSAKDERGGIAYTRHCPPLPTNTLVFSSVSSATCTLSPKIMATIA